MKGEWITAMHKFYLVSYAQHKHVLGASGNGGAGAMAAGQSAGGDGIPHERHERDRCYHRCYLSVYGAACGLS